MRRLMALLMLWMIPSSCASMSSDAMAVIRTTTAQQIDPALPAEDLTAWLARTFHHEVKWTVVPGCADTHHEHDDRVCAIAMIPFNDGLRAGVYIDVGDRQQIKGPARLNFAFWEEEQTGNRFHEVTKLSEFPEIVARTAL